MTSPPVVDPVIEICDLTKNYGSVRAVDHVSFAVGAGTITGFLGPNGSGKSTTLRILVGLVEATGGTARITGRPYHELADPLSQVGTMLEAAAHPARTARSHLRAVAVEAGRSPSHADELLELVELDSAAHRRVAGFSLGMRQRLGLATALVGDPGILVLDEPANGLDPQGIRWLRDFLRGLAEQGRTILLSSHVLAEVAQTVEHVVVLDRGRLVAHQPLAEFLDVTEVPDVSVRSSRPDVLATALEAAGLEVSRRPDGALTVVGSQPAAIGQLAFDHDVVVHEMQVVRPDLEETFLSLTAPARQETST